jgi:hypothetical protein
MSIAASRLTFTLAWFHAQGRFQIARDQAGGI